MIAFLEARRAGLFAWEHIGHSVSAVIQLIGPAFAIAMLGAIESLLTAVVADGAMSRFGPLDRFHVNRLQHLGLEAGKGRRLPGAALVRNDLAQHRPQC